MDAEDTVIGIIGLFLVPLGFYYCVARFLDYKERKFQDKFK